MAMPGSRPFPKQKPHAATIGVLQEHGDRVASCGAPTAKVPSWLSSLAWALRQSARWPQCSTDAGHPQRCVGHKIAAVSVWCCAGFSIMAPATVAGAGGSCPGQCVERGGGVSVSNVSRPAVAKEGLTGDQLAAARFSGEIAITQAVTASRPLRL
jgi:hypothetical protein